MDGFSMKLDEAIELLEDRGYLVESKMNLMRGGKITNTFRIMDYIVQKGGEARTMDIAHTLLNGNGQNAITILRDKNSEYFQQRKEGNKTFWSLTDFGKQEYRKIKELISDEASVKKVEKEDKPVSSGKSIMPFEECFFATLILDAEDYSGGRECSWVSPQNVRKVLDTYEDDNNEEPLSKNMNKLREIYEKLANKVKSGELPNAVAYLGSDYDTVSKEWVPDLKDLYDVWPKGGRGSRVQRQTSLWMCVAPSRKAVVFDSNEWNRRPVKK
jgi:hypothetical protein